MYKGERFNSLTHLAGVISAIIGVSLLIGIAIEKDDGLKIVGFSVYGATLILLYSISTLYHSFPVGRFKNIFRQLDYISIYLLIAGSYTPFALITLRGAWGWTLFAIIWSLAVIGILQEILIGKKTRRYSLILYVVMGWLIVIAIKPLIASLSSDGMWWLTAGGFSYTFGVIFYLLDEKIRHFHGIWHIFVMAGSFCQFICLYNYVA
jgi:hemolysin III